MPRAKKTAAKSAKARKTTVKKTTARKTTAKKATRKTTAKRRVSAKKAAPSFAVKAISKKMTKTQILKNIAELTELSQKQVAGVFEALHCLVHGCVGKRGCGELTVPMLGVKVRRVKKKATKARMGRNPFTGEDVKIAAKPARQAVKVTALKALKELAA